MGTMTAKQVQSLGDLHARFREGAFSETDVSALLVLLRVRIASTRMLLDTVVASPEMLPVSICHHIAFQPGRHYGQDNDSYRSGGAGGGYPPTLSVGFRQAKA